MMSTAGRNLLTDIRGKAYRGEVLAGHTSLKIGGPADFFVYPQDLEDLRRLVGAAVRARVPVLPVGAGSNLLIRDAGVRGLVIKLSRFTVVRVPDTDPDTLYADAGVSLLRLVAVAAQHGLSGLEFAAGIPGTVGGAVVMNAGTPEGEIADVIERVWLLIPDKAGGTLREYPRETLTFGYRTSPFLAGPGPGIIVGARFRLRRRTRVEVETRVRATKLRRMKTQPLSLPNAGSIFKNPPGAFAGRLIEAAGLKGARIGDAKVSELHANFIVNCGRATARDVLRLIRLVERQVQEVHGIRLEREVRVVGRQSRTTATGSHVVVGASRRSERVKVRRNGATPRREPRRQNPATRREARRQNPANE